LYDDIDDRRDDSRDIDGRREETGVGSGVARRAPHVSHFDWSPSTSRFGSFTTPQMAQVQSLLTLLSFVSRRPNVNASSCRSRAATESCQVIASPSEMAGSFFLRRVGFWATFRRRRGFWGFGMALGSANGSARISPGLRVPGYSSTEFAQS